MIPTAVVDAAVNIKMTAAVVVRVYADRWGPCEILVWV